MTVRRVDSCVASSGTTASLILYDAQAAHGDDDDAVKTSYCWDGRAVLRKLNSVKVAEGQFLEKKIRREAREASHESYIAKN